MTFVRVTGTSFVRDTNSMGLSNTDVAAKEEYYNKVRMLRNQKEQINKVNEEMAELKSDLVELKQMMAQLLACTKQ